MMRRSALLFPLLSLLLAGCLQNGKEPSETQEKPAAKAEMAQPEAVTPDSSLADVYKPWDGHWKGTFSIYVDSTGQGDGPAQPEITDRAELADLPLKLSSQIQVEQFYASESPFYQTVRILDTYPGPDGTPQTVESTGYNAVRGDTMICVVNKPDEQVVHIGRAPTDSVIIWGRSLVDPLKVEYFYEKVEGNTYSILGWGYYGKDDPTKAPKMWFEAAYERVVE